MRKVKKLQVISFAKVQAIAWGFFGLLMGILYSFGGFIIDTMVTLGWITTTETPGLSYGTLLAFGALIGMPLIFAAIGFAFGIVEACLFNLYAKLVGGVRLQLEKE